MSESSSDSTNRTHRYSFQHFDQECDFGIETANGERIRKRKRPGRKPNPPTLQERRAQNRAAQRAFREREQERRREKDRQWSSYVEEIRRLKSELAISQYEAKYLKACVLHMTLKFLILEGYVPHVWTESRIIPSNSHGEYKRPVYGLYGQPNEVLQTPALLDMILENQNIVDFDKALHLTSQTHTFETSEGMPKNIFQKFVREETVTLNKNSQEPVKNFPTGKKRRTSTENDRSTQPSATPLHKEMPSPAVPPLKEEPTPTLTHEETNQQLLVIHQKPIIGVISEPPSLRTAEDFAHMPTLQALHILRLQLKLGSILGEFTTAALLPTALQRVIPHDIRIDYVPGASIRDRMIMFQGYYNMDDCFQQLTRNTCFVGGDIRNMRNWVIDPMYTLKYWFLSHQLIEQNYGECLNREDVANLAEEYIRNGFDQQQMSNDETMPARFDKYGNSFVPLQSVYLNGIRK